MYKPLRIVPAILLCLVCFILPALVFEGSYVNGQINSSDEFELRLKEFMGDRSVEKPGGVLIVKQSGKPHFYFAAGSSNLENFVFIDSNTVFEAASVSKQFAAAAILLLVEEAKLSLEDDVRKYIPEMPDYGVKISIKHLLVHTSGLKDWRNISYLHPVYTANRLYTMQTALEIISSQKTLNFNPGEQYRYSNSGYDLLGIVVERISGTPFHVFAKNKLLNPAGMNNSGFRNKYTDIIKNRATGYIPSGKEYKQGIVLDETYGAAGLYTTVADLQKWNEFVISDKVSENFKILRTTQAVLNNGKVIPYALGGVEIHEYNGETEIRHGGLISGYRAWLVYYPNSGISASYLSNDRGLLTTTLSNIIREVSFGKPAIEQPFINPGFNNKEVENLVGYYMNIDDNAGYIKIELKDGKLVSGANEVKFYSKNKMSINNQIYYIKKNELKQTSEFGDFVFEKVENLTKEIPFNLITGNYYSEDVKVEYKIEREEESLFINTAGLNKIKLVPLFKRGNTISFRGVSNDLGVIYHFTISKSNEIELIASLPRADKIPFKKKLNK